MSIQEFMKEGTTYLTGVQEAILKNIEAATKLSTITRTSLGPAGMNKMIVNSLEKLFVTSDAATIIRELDVVHPAAKLLVFAAQMQDGEVGDGTNFTVTFAGELLNKAADLLRNGLHPSEIIRGYNDAYAFTIDTLCSRAIPSQQLKNLHDVAEVTAALRPTIASKLSGYEDLFAPIVAQACISVCPENPSGFNVDNVRIAKIPGMGVDDTTVLNGLALPKGPEGVVMHVDGARIAIFANGVDAQKTETKGTVLIRNADELLNYSSGEDKFMADLVQSIVDTGVNVVVSGASISSLAQHYFEKHGVLLVKATSKFDLRRLARAVNATPILKFERPTPEQLGRCKTVRAKEVGSTIITVFEHAAGDATGVSTIVVRAATQNMLNDVERALEDAINIYKVFTKDGRMVPGAGATEMELALLVGAQGNTLPGMDQYAFKKFAEALEVVPRTLAETSGLDTTETIRKLYALHKEGSSGVTKGIDTEEAKIGDAVEMDVWDALATKLNALRLATDAANTVLSVDQLIMAREAGGIRPHKMSARDAD
jgi:T-complex protein 1 subunit theta